MKYSRFGTHIRRLREPAGHLDPFLEAPLRRFRWTVEFRDPRGRTAEIFAILERHAAALCLHDKMEHPFRLTAGWSYVRFHGQPPDGLYTERTLSRWARPLRAWLDEGRDLYVYFNNDLHGHALVNARQLRGLLEKVHA